jgi:hypothetical protein
MNRLLIALLTGAALWTVACNGGGGSTITPPPAAGNYSLASLRGTYAFITNGEVFNGSVVSPLARVGSFMADGAGHITGGVEDVNADGTITNAISITGGSYTVKADGRGTLTFLLGQNTLDFGIVLTSTSDGLLIDETSNSNQASTGSGNFIKQTGAPFTVGSVSGAYVFDFAGLDGGHAPESFIGEFTANSGVIGPGQFDDNDNFSPSNGAFVGNLAADPVNPQAPIGTFGRGIAQMANQSFIFYIVDSSRVRFLSTSAGMLVGDAVSQSNIPANLSAISGGFAFLVGGSSAHGGLTRVGRFNISNGAFSKILMDVNDAGLEAALNNLSNGSITAFDPTTGRGTLSLQSPIATYSFVFYLSSSSGGVIQEVTAPAGSATAVVVDDGSLLLQSGSPFTASNISGNYAMNWSGLVTAGGTGFQDEEDLVSQVKVSTLSLSGISDIFQFTSPTLSPIIDIGTGGTITFNGGDGTGDDGSRVGLTVNLSGASPINMVVYIVSPQLAFFENRDNSGSQRIVAGILKAQQ